MSSSPSFVLRYVSDYSLADLKSIVSEFFNVKDAFIDVAGNPTFILQIEHVKLKFKEFSKRMLDLQLFPILRRSETSLVLKVFSRPKPKQERKGLGLILFIATLTTIFIAGYVLWTGNRLWNEILMPNSNPYIQAAIYTACLASIIGSHELGHKIACSRHALSASTPYFIPGFPPFGTFGAIISLKDPPANRDELFDIGVSGPLSGFIVMMLVILISMILGVQVPESQAKALEEQNLVGPVYWPNSPLIFIGLFWIVESLKIVTMPQGWTLILGQTLFAAWVGSLVTFLNLLPIWQLDGGHISRAVFSRKGHRYTSILGLGILILSGYWFFALFLIFLMAASKHAWSAAEPLEDVSPLSKSRKLFYAVILFILILCFVTPPI
ncbi:MAG: site-2 protease family protein [Candidatus Bathyarchaeia archaeon]